MKPMQILTTLWALFGLHVLYVFTLNVRPALKRSPPGLNSTAKVWWAKEITPDFHMAGRLTERQIKYASEAGFRSIFSLFVYETDDAGSFGGEYLPTSAEAWATAHLSGLQYVAMIGANDPWWSVETIQKFATIIPSLRRPILLHCDRGYTITFVTLLYMANQTRYNSSFEPKIYSKEFYEITAAMGYDFTADDLKEVVANVTGEEIVANPPQADCDPKEWLDYWLAHPVSKNWYTAGQIRQCDIKVLEMTGFKSVINIRQGLIHDSKASQESVPLLNVKDQTSTYGNSEVPPRQDLLTLQKNRIHPHYGSDFISSNADVNYEIENKLEFGDDIGYNELAEQGAFKESSIKYYHVPISVNATYTVELYREVSEILKEAGQRGPVLLHCGDGRRVAYFGVLAAAIQEGYNLEWALTRVQELGFEVSPDVRPDVYDMYCKSLQANGTRQKEEL